MSDVRNNTRFAEVERLLDIYFKINISPVMDSTRVEFAQEKEEKDAKTRMHGRGIRVSGTPFGDTLTRMGLINEWSNKSAEEYLNTSLEKVSSSSSMQHDLTLLTDEWRQAAISEIGEQRYAELCEAIGGNDLATEYVNYRITSMAFDKMVDDRVPQSSMEYIVNKVQNESAVTQLPLLAKRSLNIAFNGVDHTSPLEEELRATTEERYDPSNTEKIAAYGGTLLVDAAFFRTTNMSSFAQMVGIDVIARGGIALYEHFSRGSQDSQQVTIEELLSKGMFGSDRDVFSSLRAQGDAIALYDDSYLTATNAKLSNKVMATSSYTPPSLIDMVEESNANINDFFNNQYESLFSDEDEDAQMVPLGVSSEPEPEPEKDKQTQEIMLEEDNTINEEESLSEGEGFSSSQVSSPAVSSTDEQETTSSTSGWSMDKLLSYVGLDDIFTGNANIGKNFGYTLAMLPDMLIGLFTGKTNSLNMKNSALPLAAILGAFFVKNPLLKMLLLMLGGGNLFNKLAHESLEDTGVMQTSSQTRYKVYADEALNPRLSNPTLRGNSLIVDIDNVPYTIQLSQTVVDAYNAGALPLNTLANAIVAQNDMLQQTISRNFEQSQQDEEQVRSRGIS